MNDQAQLIEEISRIIAGDGTKADRARSLYDLGCDRSDVVELLDMSYSQAHSIWKGRHAAERSDPDPRPVDRADHRRSKKGRPLGLELPDGGVDRPATFFLSPSQVRYITQDGHVIVRVDTNGGPHCRNCDGPLDFSIRYLGFVHKYSQSEPTDMEDHYP